MKLPQAVPELVITSLSDGDALVYHKTLHRVHSLNAVAARVLSHCDGKSELQDVVQELSSQHGEQAEDVVWLALRRLEQCRLLSQPLEGAPVSSRREFLSKWGRVAAMLPVVATMAAPLPAAAQSGGGPCINPPDCSVAPCCPGFSCNIVTCLPS